MRSEVLSIAAAVAIHAAVPLLAWVIIDPNAGRPASAQLREIKPIDIDLSEVRNQEPAPPPEAVPQEQPVPSEAVPPPAADQRVARAAVPGARDPGTVLEPGTPSPEGTGSPSAPPGPKGPAPDQYDPIAPDDGRGVVHAPPGLGTPIWALPGGMPETPRPAPAPTDAPRPRQVDKDMGGIVVREAMAEIDKKKGFDLPAAGTVATAARSAVQGAVGAPDTARVSFEVRLGPGGQVLGVRVASFNSGSAAVWDQVAQAIRGALAGKGLQLNDAYAKGAIVYVDVSSAMTLPSGSTSAVAHEGSGIKFDTADIGSHAKKSVKASFRTVAAR